MHHRTVDQRSHADIVRKDFSVVRARVGIDLVNHDQTRDQSADNYRDADRAADEMKAACATGQAYSSLQSAKENEP